MEYTPAKAMEYLSDTSQFPNPACCKIYVKDNKHNSPQNSFVLQTLSVPQSLQFSLAFAHRK